MSRCERCGSSLRKDEMKCFTCGAVVEKKNEGPTLTQRFRSITKLMFFGAVALTVASLFTDFVPSFWKCAAATVILHLVSSSAAQMSESSSKS